MYQYGISFRGSLGCGYRFASAESGSIVKLFIFWLFAVHEIVFAYSVAIVMASCSEMLMSVLAIW